MIHDICCQIARAEVLRYLGYAGQRVDEALAARFDAAVAACEKGCSPAGTFAVFPFEHAAGAIGLVGADVLLGGSDIARFLQGATHCALMAVTLGAQCERELRRLSALNPTDALLYDASCSALVEAAANGLQERIRLDAARQGLEMLPGRFSPGYGDLPLDVQKPLLAAVDAYRALGLTATGDFLLVPRKSITAVVGLREVGAEPVRLDGAAGETALHAASSFEKSSTCDACPMAGRCMFRREGESCHGSCGYRA